ncbi:SGNH/GDSL hydrolase family protein [Marinomonas foliarum]|uniref:Lysophospholipase L1-like esterase n=1 Tax=Marinomonas foliarum TaxID=491950 RepID=A0A369AI06_9GAMM|nr:SGNH/GDSL hydrolase family protein [Marinomonas foliarum]RCX08753.1 lysophospholipase L1-like esterase [Marinomonas foliarum]
MKNLLCYGDSNTHGQIPGGQSTERFGPDDRWPGVLARKLGSSWHVIEEGLSGRTTVRNDPVEGKHKNGRRYLTPCLQSHAPLDLIILMLGTNDLKRRFWLTASEVAMGISCLVHDIKELAPGPAGRVPEILIVSPPPMLNDLKEWSAIFEGAQKTSRELAMAYEIMADSLEVHFFDASSVCVSAPEDGFHMDLQAHHLLGEALAQEIVNIGWINDN